MFAKVMVYAGVCLCGGALRAAIPQDVDWTNVAEDSRFVRLTSDESTSDYSTGDWTTKWSGAKPQAGKWYFTNGKRLFVPSNMTAPFPGDLLVLNSQFRNPGSSNWQVKDFVALSGGFLGIRGTSDVGLSVSGDMHVSTSDGPFQIVADNSSRKTNKAQTIGFSVAGALTGDETAEIHFGSSAGVYKTNADGSRTLYLVGREVVTFAPVEADALRLVVTETWGGGKAHVFALDAR